MNLANRARGQKEDGAMLLEFALVIGVVAAFIFAIIDVGRVLLIQHVLDKATENAVSDAKVATDLRFDVRQWAAVTDQAAEDRFLSKREAILLRAEELALTTAHPADSDAPAVLSSYRLVDDPAPTPHHVVLLLPGQSVERVSRKRDGGYERTVVEHPTCPRDNCVEFGLAGGLGNTQMLRRHPIVAEAHATVDTLLFGRLTTTARALAWMEQGARGSGDARLGLPEPRVLPPPPVYNSVPTTGTQGASRPAPPPPPPRYIPG
ncbi:MAG: pilus assembly protein [Bdellovibrionales bacterium]|nr:pilus assembly protein [Bdellovibrionales bacterium]